MPRASRVAAAIAAALIPLSCAHAGEGDPADTIRTLDQVLVRGTQPTSLPVHIPATVEGISGDVVREKINATDAEDALKYFPSLLVRKRFIGDYDHAVLATRASGTGNSARSLVYADGILLSNLLGNGASFTPRWGFVSPAEIERVDVLYGPFSAAYPGNSVGAVVDYVTRMPERFEAHAALSYSHGEFDLDRDEADDTARGAQISIGNRWGKFAAWLSLNRLDSSAHPIAFANVLASAGTAGTGVAVTGAVAGDNPKGQPWYLLGASGQTDTVQDLAKLKLAWDIAPDTRLSLLLGVWRNNADRDAQSYLRDAAGASIYSGPVLIDGRRYVVSPTALSMQRAELRHAMQGLSLRRNRGGRWDYALDFSRYDYARDGVRSPTLALPMARDGGAGRIANGDGTGWTSANASATWRPGPRDTLEFGIQHDRYQLRTEVSSTTDWLHGAPQSRFSAFAGRTGLRSAFVQHSRHWSPRWNSVLGLRGEQWTARDGLLANAVREFAFPQRRENSLSPKGAIEYVANDAWALKLAAGRAIRYPTVSELYQGSIASDAVVNNDPGLKPERTTTSELSWVGNVRGGNLRATLFHERTRDALYSQTNATVTPSVTNIQNVGAIRTSGIEVAGRFAGVLRDELDLDASVTFADSIIRENANFPASIGRWQPRVPRWRANLLATWHAGERWDLTGGLRYSGQQFNTLDNSDTHSDAYTGTSPFLVADARLRYRHDARWSAALGVDNLSNRTYWNFHPYNQRTWSLELRFDQ
ncbi:TonB-dependent receptor [Thermomonas sp. HDW16]|nr:TonB-dependent receptor [Thermomonas sp. HDW16]